MRQNGVHAVIARCEACGHVADVNVDALAGTIIVPEVGRRLRCSECGGNRTETRPAWHAASGSARRARSCLNLASAGLMISSSIVLINRSSELPADVLDFQSGPPQARFLRKGLRSARRLTLPVRG
jgi:hypothetical protein